MRECEGEWSLAKTIFFGLTKSLPLLYNNNNNDNDNIALNAEISSYSLSKICMFLTVLEVAAASEAIQMVIIIIMSIAN